MIGIGVACFLAGVMACYLWFENQPSGASQSGVDGRAESTFEDSGTGFDRRTAAGNHNARAAKFEALDLDRDGMLSLTEFARGRKPVEAEKWFKLRDVNTDGFISREEFLPFSPVPKTQ